MELILNGLPWATSMAMGYKIWRSPTPGPAPSRCCWATAMGPSGRRGPSQLARLLRPSPWGTSTVTASLIWRRPAPAPTASRCCWATAMGPSRPRGTSLRAAVLTSSRWATSTAMACRIWRRPTSVPTPPLTPPSRCCWAMAMGPSGRRRHSVWAVVLYGWPQATSMAMGSWI